MIITVVHSGVIKAGSPEHDALRYQLPLKINEWLKKKGYPAEEILVHFEKASALNRTEYNFVITAEFSKSVKRRKFIKNFLPVIGDFGMNRVLLIAKQQKVVAARKVSPSKEC